jgi:uncharacterized HAD superfamily protein
MKHTAMLDIDDTLLSFGITFNRYMNKKYSNNVRFDDLTNYDPTRIYGISKLELESDLNEFYLSHEHANMDKIPASEVVLNRLLEIGFISDIIIVTSRHEDIRELTLDILKKSFPSGLLDGKELFMLGHFGSGDTSQNIKICKSDVCINHEVSAAFEDNIDHAKAIAKKGIMVFLLSAPWNIDFDEEEFNKTISGGVIIRKPSWLGILSYVNRQYLMTK